MIELFHGDCLEVMDRLIEQNIQVDSIITDPPYQITKCKWDSIIPFEPMWKRLNKLIKPNRAIVLFGSEPFSSALRMSNIKNYKYDWIWDKNLITGMTFAKYQPMRRTEQISVFYKNSCLYNPQMELRDKPLRTGGPTKQHETAPHTKPKDYKKIYTHRYPTNILYFPKLKEGNVHPTQKPVALLEYLIRTYTNENEVILDFTMGVFSTAIASLNTKRNFIGIELDKDYFKLGKERIEKHLLQLDYRPQIFYNE